MKLILAGSMHYLAAFVLAMFYVFSEDPDRIAFLLASLMFIVNGAAERIIAHVKAAAK